MKEYDQIAAEAWKDIQMIIDVPYLVEGIALIKAAIEKALKQQNDETVRCIEMVGGLRAAQAGEDFTQAHIEGHKRK